MTSSLVGSEMCIRDSNLKDKYCKGFTHTDKEAYLMEEVEEYTPKEGEVEPFIKERDQLEEDQLLK
eukprot:12216062-Prorocentrum_lima.AAC.1